MSAYVLTAPEALAGKSELSVEAVSSSPPQATASIARSRVKDEARRLSMSFLSNVLGLSGLDYPVGAP
jgi:hypothetical protein